MTMRLSVLDKGMVNAFKSDYLSRGALMGGK